MLFLGCVDLRGALQAAIDTEHKKPKTLHIHLNDINPSVLAQNILLLKIISEPDFNPNCEQDIDFLWNVWYNVEWPETTRARFQLILNHLLYEEEKLADVCFDGSSQLQSLKSIWSTWSSMSSYMIPNSKFLKKIQEERYVSFYGGKHVRPQICCHCKTFN